MTQEEKARAYDEAKARMSRAFNSNRCTIGFMNEIFPELTESNDERIRKDMIAYFKHDGTYYRPDSMVAKIWIAWLEKQGEQKPVEMKSAEESLGISSKEYNKIVDDCIFGEQKPYDYENANIQQKDFAKSVEWSEEDENHVDSLLKRLKGLCRNEFATTRFAISEDENWLKSLRPQNRWRPSDKQMQALSNAGNSFRPFEEGHKVLWSLYNDLKKLKE